MHILFYVQNSNQVDAVTISFAFTAVTIAASNLIQTRCCFKEGTLVETEEGLKPIEEIEVGDKVLAYDEATGEQAYKPVVQLFRNTTEEWYHVRVNGEEIICTGGHPFYVVNAASDRKAISYESSRKNTKGAWICAHELKLSDKVLLSDGTCAIIEEIQVEHLSKPETTYNFEVEDYHTYYVSESNVLVHNKCTNPGGRHGGDAHREKVKKIKDDLTDKGWTVSEKEVGIRTANGKLRYPDITATKDGVTRYYQIGKQTKMGRPIARELRALRDIGSTNTGKVFFVPYN